MRHYTDKNGNPVTPAMHTGSRVHFTAKTRNRTPDVFVAVDEQGRFFYGDCDDAYVGATEISCANCERHVVIDGTSMCAARFGSDDEGNGNELLSDDVACDEWEAK